VVDDDEVTRKVVRIILKTHGFRVFLASNWRDAVRICLRFGRRIDLVMSEVRMPEISGLEFAGHLHQILPEVPVLLMSGSFIRLDPLALEETSAGAEFLAKPFTQKVLLSKLQVLMPCSRYGAN